MTWDRTPVLPPSVVCPLSGVSLCLLNQMEEALGLGKREKGVVWGHGFRDLESGNKLEKPFWWAWSFFISNNSKRFIEIVWFSFPLKH